MRIIHAPRRIAATLGSLPVRGLGVRIWDLGLTKERLGVWVLGWDLGFGIWDLGLGVGDLGSAVCALWLNYAFGVEGVRCRMQRVGCRVQDAGCRLKYLRCRV